MFAGGRDVLGHYTSEARNDPLKFIVSPANSKLWKQIKNEAYNFEKYNITYNSHSWGIGIETFLNTKALHNMFIPVTTSVDIYGKTYVSSMEAHKYPFYGVQFHPEKP